MAYATISLFRSLTNQNREVISDSVLSSILPIADRLVNKIICSKVCLERLSGNINGTNKDFKTRHAPIADTTLKNVTVVDNCDTADFTASADAVDDALAGRLTGSSGSSIAMGKSGTASASINYTKASTSVDGTGKRLRVTVYIKDTQELSVSNAMSIRIGNSSSAYYVISFYRSDLIDGINEIDVPLTDMGTVGTPTYTALDYIYIEFNVAASANTITAGNLKMDFWRLEDIDSLDIADIEVFYATTDDSTGWTEYGSAQTITSIQDKEGIITMATAPTSSTAEAGVFASYAYVSKNMDWNLVNPAACYMAAHIASFIISGQAPNYDAIADSFARRDLAGAPDEWLRLSLSLLINAVGEDSSGIGFRCVETNSLTGV